MTAEPGFNGATLLSADSRLGSESVDAVEPLPGPFRDHIRHHSVSGLPSQDSKGSRSSCTSSCSASSASSSLTSSTSSSLSCSATSSSSSSSPFFSPSEFYNSLFGNSHGNSDIGNSNSSNHNYDHSIDPLSSAPSPSLSSSLSTLNPPIIVTTTTKPTTMGGARQIRSGSWTSSFSLSSLSIPKNSTRAATPDTLSPIGSRSPESYPLPSAGTQTRSNPQPSISQYSNPVSPTGTFPPCSSSSTSTSPPCAFSPMSLPPLPLFVSLSPTTGSALHSSNSLLSIVQGDDHPSTPHSIVTMGAPLTIAFQSNDLGGMVTATEARAMSGNAHPQTYAQQHPCAVHTPPQDHHGAQSFEAGANRLEMCLPSRSNSSAPVVGARSLAPPTSFKSSSCNSEPGFTSGSRRSSKDSLDSVPGVTLDDLVDQLTIPDYVNTLGKCPATFSWSRP
ncbi:hypothetical protein BC939DRAFT_72718 [Gamsiella multidivaricata]|uniref:uncharacterized protein n=1 Tax=Gamsiella multidivaricata TaxID=101098 RepID=UPI00221FF8BE|nr:uncharacterized protein BC939DRAFT_72718 [Gamsiella multidivaricata]KAI7828262.1 hypothetical protein BC939DRAFT_72718 [Gamsiella multidivaricata]